MPRRHRLVTTCIATVAAGLLVSGGLSGGTAQAGPADGSTAAGSADGQTAVGAYLHYGPPGIARMAELSEWLGGRDLKVAHTYLPGDLWTNIEGRPEFLRPWAQWRQGAEDRMFVLNVPMLDRNEDRLPDVAVAQLLRAGARGQYDHHYRTLATRLVQAGVPDTVIVLGWEMNGTTYTHRCGPDPTAWKAYWNSIVTAMRSVPGQKFRFDFAPNRGRDAVPWTECYPGDDVVDIIGMDSYDQPPGESFDDQVNAPYGLQKQVEFAAEHDKAISYPEWGLFRNGDNPEYMRRMLEWIDRHKPLYQTITDYCPHGVWQCGSNPESSKVFRSKLFANSGPAQPSPAPSDPAPAEPVPSEPVPSEPPAEPTPAPVPADDGPNAYDWCMPADFRDWVAAWVPEEQLCVSLPGTPDLPF
ncbi:glycoside hydrolase family 26 protein [Streptomyces sp. t39]|uniref:glycoside hydrolase family 26 protein n=1 Tax=Streptomyces sp. t39 TaxID=1828156 RepID=UPI0011CDB66F|nr:glycosyl hydrolase [Streptomyces sp. t39]TXS56655.1 glycosyl hydrolase family 26 [Streptomyces sp. t39]